MILICESPEASDARREAGTEAAHEGALATEVAASPGAALREPGRQNLAFRLRPGCFTCNLFLVTDGYNRHVVTWTFLSNHGRALLCIARDPGIRLRDVAALLEITERRAHGIVTDLVESGYIVKTKDGRRNRYQVRTHLPLPEPTASPRTIGDVLELLAGTAQPPQARHPDSAPQPGDELHIAAVPIGS